MKGVRWGGNDRGRRCVFGHLTVNLSIKGAAGRQAGLYEGMIGA
jgi:hypothetical protein